jgi:2-polyprenyl-3-methyl-5-hydroxy-6-metoxy-1,4-benzoquinol methylase
MEKAYIDENANIHLNANAENLLNKNSDIIYYDAETQGIHKVNESRWNLAQKYERKTWMEGQLTAKDDRNFEHLKRFKDFSSLDTHIPKIENIVELGCGPFTNVRLFQNFKNLKNITLVDPLLNDYLNHPNCTYKGDTLNDINLTKISSPIEKLSDTQKYDAVVMINVIEHCFDVNLIFEKILSLLNQNGIIIFSDVYFKDVYTLASNLYDAGHPLRLSEKKLNSFISEFIPIFDERYEKLYNQEWRDDIYFIGQKK